MCCVYYQDMASSNFPADLESDAAVDPHFTILLSAMGLTQRLTL